MTLGSEDRLLLAAAAASLARRGWSAARTAALLAEALPQGSVRAEMAAAGAALARGEADAGAGARENVVALLARGDAAGAEALAELARAESLEMKARRSAVAALGYPIACLALASMLIAVSAIVFPTIKQSFPVFLGLKQGLLLTLVHASLTILGIVGSAMLIASLVWLVGAARGKWLPGVRALRAASALRVIAAGLGPQKGLDPDAIGLDRRERGLASRLLEPGDPARAARTLAIELERNGREAQRLAAILLPVAGVILLAITGTLVALTILLPLLTVASI